MIQLTDADTLASRYPGTPIHERNGELLQFGTWHHGDDEGLLPFSQADLDTWATAPLTPEIPLPVKLIAHQLLALWATTGLPAPPDWPTARLALKAWRKAAPTPDEQMDRLETASELLSLRFELSDQGGTWPQVLSIADLGLAIGD